MSRAIKFRAWNTAANYWLDGMTLILHCSGNLINVPDNLILMQSTGLHDKNGREIYEGDIVRGYHAIGSLVPVYQVFWNGDRWDVKDAFGNAYERVYHWEAISWNDLEIIGNIYENSDLLKAREP